MAVKKKKKKINKSVIMIAVLSVLVIIGFLFITTNPSFWFKKSIHGDAKKYSTRSCLVFYPNNENGKKVAKELCKGAERDSIFDYSLVPYGDYYLVSYGNGVEYFTDKQYKTLVINEVSDEGKKIIADYLRYQVKKDKPELYYDSNFIETSYIDNLDFSDVTYDISDEFLKCNFPKYEIDVYVPLKYMQTQINMNFDYPNELYVKPTYIDPNHPVICLTFDDGPQFWYEPNECSSVAIVDTLYKYDVTATFYVVGDALQERDVWTDYQAYSFLKKSINNGNEYGSHTQGHDDLDELSTAEGIKNAISGPAEFLDDLLGYKMLTYRPPGGFWNNDVLSAQPYPAILWNVDSEDWVSRDADTIYNKVMSYELDDGDVLLFHEIYDETAQAIEKIIPELINQGYQMVTVKDMLQYEGLDVNTLKYYYNLNPWPYYE